MMEHSGHGLGKISGGGREVGGDRDRDRDWCAVRAKCREGQAQVAATPKGQQNKRVSLEWKRLMCKDTSSGTSDALPAAEEHIIMVVPRPAPSRFGLLFLRQAFANRPINLHLPR